jgi:hypothetical protein
MAFCFDSEDFVIKIVNYFDEELLKHLNEHKARVFEFGIPLIQPIRFISSFAAYSSGRPVLDLINSNSLSSAIIITIIYQLAQGLKELHDLVCRHW